MNATALVLLLFLAGNVLADESPRVPRNRVLSSSRQFIVYADDPLAASRLCARAEQLRRLWIRFLDLDGKWRDPIAIVVTEQNRVLTQPGAGHLKYQLDCRADVTDDVIGALIIETLCRELANRELVVTAATANGVHLPPWLPVGLREVLEGVEGELLPVIQRTMAGGRPWTMGRLQKTTSVPTNQIDRLVYRANAWLLVDGLFRLPGGASKLRQFITSLKPGAAPSWTFGLTYTGDFADQTQREKRWGRQLARKCEENVPESLSVSETTTELDAILRTDLTQPTGPPHRVNVTELWRFTHEPWFDKLVADKFQRLQSLQQRTHPFYRETVGQYLAAFMAVKDGSVARFRRYLNRAAAARAEMDRYSQAVDRYLATVERQRGLSNDAELLRRYAPAPPPPRRTGEKRDPISDYLDQFDQ